MHCYGIAKSSLLVRTMLLPLGSTVTGISLMHFLPEHVGSSEHDYKLTFIFTAQPILVQKVGG